jgi:hypothetical protein
MIIGVRTVVTNPDLVVDDENTVEQLKQAIYSKKKVLVERQLLVYYKDVLQDKMTLKSYGIGHKSKIRLSEYSISSLNVSPVDECDSVHYVPVIQVPGAMPISYKMKNKQGYLRVRKKEKISDVKDKISTKESVDVNSFRLTFRQNALDDDATVAGSGIIINSIIDCASPIHYITQQHPTNIPSSNTLGN